MKPNKSKYLLHLILFIPPLLWVLYRLSTVDVTHDEAWSFRMAYQQYYNAMLGTANNHWLNTFFIFIEAKILGTEIWKIRLHSLGALILLAYYLHKIALRIPNIWMGCLAIVLVTYNTYTMDFFSIARGYGLGLAFGMAATYYIVYQSEGVKNRLRIYALLCLASISVYTELYLLLGYGLYELLFVFKLQIFTKKQFINYIKPLWLPFLFLIAAIANILYIKKCGDLNEGMSNGFFQDTLGVFIERAFEPWFYSHTAVIIGSVLFIFLILSMATPLRYRIDSKSKKLGILLLVIFGIQNLFFYAFGTPYSFGRTALFYIVPLVVGISMFIGELRIKPNLQFIPAALFCILFFGHVSYAIMHKNIHTTQEWWMGQGVSKAVDKIATIEKRDFSKLSILFYEGHNGDYDNYYMRIPNQKIIKNKSRIHPFSFQEDFNKIGGNPNTFDYILLPDYDSILNSTIQFQLYDSIEYYPDMKTWLLQKKF